ncbi:MAG: diguanylate cyclase [Betaproteobacteria bacterium]|nr:MAG: diguanylate cyclase [Betaproteobacteria bacterium]
MEFLLLACVIVVAAIWVLTRYLMRPLVLLTHHFASYTATEARIAPLTADTGSGEIRALRAAFNRLASRLHEREDALIETMHKYQIITDNSTDLITKHSPDGIITFASQVSSTILGMAPGELTGHSLCEFVHPEDFGIVRTAMKDAVQANVLPMIIYRARHTDQHYVWFETTLRLIKESTGEETQTILCVSRDISERKRMEERLHDLVRTDHLTTLPNRFLLDERFANGLAQAQREGSLLAMLMIDIDRFKNINDTRGHGMGDVLLKVVGSALKSCIREPASPGTPGFERCRCDRPAMSGVAERAVRCRRPGTPYHGFHRHQPCGGLERGGGGAPAERRYRHVQGQGARRRLHDHI